MAGPVLVSHVEPDVAAAVAAVAPLAAALSVSVGPFVVPASLLAGDGRVEAVDSEAGAATRVFLREDPWAGMGSVHPGGWMLLARDDDHIAIGQRRGAVGLGQVVTLTRSGARFDATAMSGPRLTTGIPVEQVDPVYGVTADGDTVTLSWDCGADFSGRPQHRVDRVLVAESTREVHVLIVSTPSADSAIAHEYDFETGAGIAARTVVHVPGSLGSRSLFTDHRVPAELLAVTISSGLTAASAPKRALRRLLRMARRACPPSHHSATSCNCRSASATSRARSAQTRAEGMD